MPPASDWFTESFAALAVGPTKGDRKERFERPVPQDYVHVSRQLGVTDTVPRNYDLRRAEVQERFRAEIRADLDRATPEGRRDALAAAVVGYRKLREGIVSSGRLDAFAVEAYEESVGAAREAEDWDEMKRSLQHLVYEIYPGVGPQFQGGWPKHAKLLLLFFICFAVAQAPPEGKVFLHGSVLEIWTVLKRLPRHVVESEDVRWALRLLSLLRFVDYARFAAAVASAAPDELSLISFVLGRYRIRVAAILHKAYYTMPANLVARYLLFDDVGETAQFLAARYPASRVADGIVSLRPLSMPKKS
ncbi:hypothetical protein DFJ74DRAFT_703523 [Hyaloraphidium curvatum]|nr:hypothetical protein DFJ74DRAFT_703523 [Hyaloraphidium curvatum]